MPAFTYTILAHPDDNRLEVVPCPDCAVTEPMWATLAGAMAGEPALIPYPAATLAQRWEEDHAAVLVWQDTIISYISLLPVASRVAPPGALHSWASFFAAAGLGVRQLPSLDVYEFASGWTAPAWRNKRISLPLRRRLQAHYLGNQGLGVSSMAGLASPLLARLGWQTLGWSAAPFVSSLIGLPLTGFEDRLDRGCPIPAGMLAYEGLPVPLDHATHPWSQFCYFWVSDPAQAQWLDRELAGLCGGDLRRWRRAVLDVAGNPAALVSLTWLTSEPNPP